MDQLILCLYVVMIAVFYVGATVQETECQRELRVNTAAYNAVPPRVGQRIPVCDTNGNYAPKQCSGSQCYCVDSDGVAIDGYSVNNWEAVDQNCNCARNKAEYSALGIIGKMYRCLPNGNYDPIQCTGSVCYCADHNGQKIGTATVNIGLIGELNC